MKTINDGQARSLYRMTPSTWLNNNEKNKTTNKPSIHLVLFILVVKSMTALNLNAKTLSMWSPFLFRSAVVECPSQAPGPQAPGPHTVHTLQITPALATGTELLCLLASLSLGSSPELQGLQLRHGGNCPVYPHYLEIHTRNMEPVNTHQLFLTLLLVR